MVYVWISTDENTIIRQMKGNTYTVVGLDQKSLGDKVTEYTFTLESDENERCTFTFNLKGKGDGKYNLYFFSIVSPQKSITTGTTHHNKNVGEDFGDWMNEEVKSLKGIIEKKYTECGRINELKEDF